MRYEGRAIHRIRFASDPPIDEEGIACRVWLELEDLDVGEREPGWYAGGDARSCGLRF